MLKTVAEVIEKLGGTSKTAEIFDVGPSAVSNWKRDGRFPARLHYRISRELAARGEAVDPALFGEEGETTAGGKPQEAA